MSDTQSNRQVYFEKLRETYPEFIFDSFDMQISDDKNELILSYSFKIPGLKSFTPKWIFKLGDKKLSNIQIKELEPRVFALGMTELISCWKCACPPLIKIKCRKISRSEAEFWKQLFFDGLGEFRYLNGISEGMENFVNFSEDSLAEYLPDPHITQDKNHSKFPASVLIPVGGGKDSVVSLEKLRSDEIERYAYSINPSEASKRCIEISGIPEENRVFPERILDKGIIELNRQGYLNGHTPFSAIVAFSSLISAKILGIRDIALSNEGSASEATVSGSKINHQYSKSFEFEFMLQNYIKSFFGGGQRYFSLLRPFSELSIAREFSAFDSYFKIFRSCNRGSKKGVWCCACPKCLFVFGILYPFLDDEKLMDIFGENILEKKELENTFNQLLGFTEEKPFECVGTVAEFNFAIVLGINRRIKNTEKAVRRMESKAFEKLPFLIKRYIERGLYSKNPFLTFQNKGENQLKLEFLYDVKNPFENFYENSVPDEYMKFVSGMSDRQDEKNACC